MALKIHPLSVEAMNSRAEYDVVLQTIYNGIRVDMETFAAYNNL